VPEEHCKGGGSPADVVPVRILFLYNADSGVLAAMLDSARKLARSPDACPLCSITHGVAGKKKDWRRIECSLELPGVYCHRDELPGRVEGFLEAERLALPVVLFENADGSYEVAVTAAALGECRGSPECLKARIQDALGRLSLR
jgi:hypothetical protein